MPFLGLDLVLLHLHLGLCIDMVRYFDLFKLQWLVLHVDFLLERSPADLISVLFQHHISAFLFTIDSNTVLILEIVVIIAAILDHVKDRLLSRTACLARRQLLLIVCLGAPDTLLGRLHTSKVARGALLVVTASLHHDILNLRDALLRHFLPLVEVLLTITVLQETPQVIHLPHF